MTWIGRKKLAFVPLYRSNAHPPDQIPPNWPDLIMRRATFDPDPTTHADRSLRAFIRTASSGLADLEAVVMPMATVDQQDVPPGILEGQLGAKLRSQGFDAAAIVMLGGPGAGTSAGYWVRFVMAEGVGVWAMEFMHSLTGFADLYSLPGYTTHPHGDMGAFDEMAASIATHPSAYTKSAIKWMNGTSIAQLQSREANYDLYSVSLQQPPPAGRVAAVRVGSSVPYLMVEGRQRADPFDANIPSEGVIMYRVETTDPLGHAQNKLIPTFLLTGTALKEGQAFTEETGVTVRVVKSLTDGFSVHVEDAKQHVVDRSAQFKTPAASGPPTVVVIPGLGVNNIAYRDTAGHLHELWRDAQGNTGTTDLTANAGAPAALGNPFAYVDTSTNSEILLYRGGDNDVHSLYWSLGPVGHDNLTGSVNAPKAVGDPAGWFSAPDQMHHVVYRLANGHLHELWWTGPNPVGHGDITGSFPTAAGDPSAYLDTTHGMNIVAYRSGNGHINTLYWTTGAVGHDDLSGFAGTPAAAGDPVGYYTAYNDTHQIVYRAGNGHIYELYWAGNAPVTGWDLMPAGAPPATGNPSAYYSAGTNTKHVFYRSADGRLHEIWWVPGGGTPAHVDVTAAYNAPLAADRPAGFTVEGPNTQHMAYRGSDNHIYEVIW